MWSGWGTDGEMVNLKPQATVGKDLGEGGESHDPPEWLHRPKQ